MNHTLLTLAVARQRRLPLAGLIVNETTPVQSLADQANVEELSKRITVPLLAVVPFQTNPYGGEIAALAGVDWRRLAGGHAG